MNLVLFIHFSDILPSVWNRPALLWVLLNGRILQKESRDKGLRFGFVSVMSCSGPVRLEERVNPWN